MVLFDKVDLFMATTSAARRAITLAIRAKGFAILLFEEEVQKEDPDHKEDSSNYDEIFKPLHRRLRSWSKSLLMSLRDDDATANDGSGNNEGDDKAKPPRKDISLADPIDEKRHAI